MHEDPEKITYFGITDARNKRIPFGIKTKDRSRHLYVIGKTGMGKSNLLEVMGVQDIRNGEGLCFIDPHGKTAELLLEHIPPERKNDVLYFAPFDTEHPVSFNVLEDVGIDKRHLVVSGLMSSFKKIWQDAWSARMEYILTNTLLALLEYPDSTLLMVNKMLSDKAFRKKVVDNVTDVSVKSFWVDEFANYTERMAAEAVPAIQNKVGQFTANPLIRNILGQPKSTFDLRELIDTKKIIIVNLSKGRIGEANAQLLGSMLVTKIYLAAMSRADISEATLNTLPSFYLYVDEFQSFANESFADILSEARKYKLSLNIAHQYVEQMPEEVRNAVFGNVGTMITFRVGATDAEHLEKEFAPVFEAQDIVNLGRFQMYLRLMIDGVGSQPFSAMGLPPLEHMQEPIVDEVIEASRKQFACPKAEVDLHVQKMLGLGEFSKSNTQQNNNAGSNRDQNKKPGNQKGKQNEYGNNKPQNNQYERSNKKENVEQKNKPMLDETAKKELQAMLAATQQKKQETPEPAKEDVADESAALSKAIEQKKRQHDAPKSNSGKPDPKKVSNENRDGLKGALAAVLGESFKPEESKKEAETKKEHKQDQNHATVKNQSNENNNKSNNSNDTSRPKEVSTEDLRKILEA